jgi:DNA-directed RNA polymerase subunit M/transcription elongation factor TFIIS
MKSVSSNNNSDINEYMKKDKQRVKYIELFIKKLDNIICNVNDRILTAVSLEKGCFNAVILRCIESDTVYNKDWNDPNFVNMYSTRCYTVLSQINPVSYLVRKLLSKDILPANVGTMKADELDPESSKAQKEYLNLRLNQKIQQKVSDKKCNKFGCDGGTTEYTKQFRSLDEGNTIVYTCIKCGAKQYG